MRILIVEDSDSLRRLFSGLLSMRGFEVHEATDGEDALQQIAGFMPDLVLTDVMMPRLDGVELIRRLKSKPALASVPMIAMTAVTSAGELAQEAGAIEVLYKPIEIDKLVDCLHCYVSGG